MAINLIDKLPVPSVSKTKKGLPSGADNGLDALRNSNVEKFQKNTYAGLTEHLAVVLRVETINVRQTGKKKGVIGTRGENISRHSLITDSSEKKERETVVVRARIISSNVHEYMPKPFDSKDHQVIDLYPTFEISEKHFKDASTLNVEGLIRVQFYDRDISSKRNSNGQILGIVAKDSISNYSRFLAFRQEPTPRGPPLPPPRGNGGPQAPGAKPGNEPGRYIPNSALKDVSQDDKPKITDVTENGVKYKEILPRWPLNLTPSISRGQYKSGDYEHKGYDMRTAKANGKNVLATLDGVVDKCAFDPPKGKYQRSGGAYIRIKHADVIAPDGSQGIYSYYMHMSKFLVKPGAKVKRGACIGLSGGGTFEQMQKTAFAKPWPAPGFDVTDQGPVQGNPGFFPPVPETVKKWSGGTTAPHLHFEARTLKKKVMPLMDFFKKPSRVKV
jgi:hypothetical protein